MVVSELRQGYRCYVSKAGEGEASVYPVRPVCYKLLSYSITCYAYTRILGIVS